MPSPSNVAMVIEVEGEGLRVFNWRPDIRVRGKRNEEDREVIEEVHCVVLHMV